MDKREKWKRKRSPYIIQDDLISFVKVCVDKKPKKFPEYIEIQFSNEKNKSIYIFSISFLFS